MLSQGLLLRSADHVVALSKNVRDDLLATGLAPGKVALLPIAALLPGLGDEVDYSTLRSVSSPDKPLQLLFLGRLITYKGLDLLAGAIALLGDRDDWRLTIAGSGPLETYISQEFGANPHVRIELGWIAPERFSAMIGEHDVLLCPYTEASQSGVIPEAARRGVTAIVTPHAGLIEQIEAGQAGLVAESTTGAAFAAAIATMIENRPLVSRLGHAAATLPRDKLLASGIDGILARRE
jgi:glycosyltransferase involved in cell wall biosynthesis